MSIVITHITLAFILFFLQNWMGARSYSKGYIRFSLLDDKDEALSLNYAIKVFGPIVYLILISATFQYLGYIQYIKNIINVMYYYLFIRIGVIFLYERQAIVNWLRISFHYASILIIALVLYHKFIDSVQNLLPDFSEIKNEIWLLILIFIYQLGNGLEERFPNNELSEPVIAYLPELKKRKKKYILKKHRLFSLQYKSIINKFSTESAFHLLIISILIFENFNRPPFVRLLERIWVKATKRTTSQGIMQIPAKIVISDIQSIEQGCLVLNEKHSSIDDNDFYHFRRVIKKHCPDKKYVRQILFIAKCIIDNTEDKSKYEAFFNEIKDEFQLYDYYD